LATSARSLQRRPQQEGSSFRTVIDDARLDWHAFISVRRTYPLLTFLICWDIRIQLPSPARSSDGPGVRREQTIALKANLSAAQCARIHALEE
jgi:hypothetical protein